MNMSAMNQTKGLVAEVNGAVEEWSEGAVER